MVWPTHSNRRDNAGNARKEKRNEQAAKKSITCSQITTAPHESSTETQERAKGDGILKIGKKLGIGTSVVQRVFKEVPWKRQLT
jgi:hypothetical protein